MKTLPILVFAVSVLLLHGCAMVPGQHLSEKALTEGNSPESGHVQLVQITPELLTANQSLATSEAIPAELLDYRPEPYRIGAGDTLYITVWDHPELTSPAGSQQQTAANGRLVRPDGTLFYPYVGQIKAAGMDIEELRQVISKKLSKYIENPQVDVGIISYGSQLITLQGAFVRTEPQSVTAVPLTVAQVIGNAGINANQADLSDLMLTRDGHSYRIDLNAPGQGNGKTLADNIYMKPGDQLFLPYNDNKEIYMMGEVLRPSAITFKTASLTLTQALGRVGGLNPVTANGRAVYVIRGVKDLAQHPATIFHLNARSPAAFALADNFKVQPGDVIFVGASGITKWNRFLSQLLPLSGIVGNAALTNQRLGN